MMTTDNDDNHFNITKLVVAVVVVVVASMSNDEHVSRYFLKRLTNSTVFYLRKSRLLNSLKKKACAEGNQ